MLLYIVRHAHAVSAEPDADRPLSRRGVQQVTAVAHFLRASSALQVREMWHSPLVRARQTAELLVHELGVEIPLREVDGLASEDNPRLVAERLHHRRESLALVGHEPHLSSLITLLLTGSPGPARVELKKCAIAALERSGDHWMLRWHVTPELLVSSETTTTP